MVTVTRTGSVVKALSNQTPPSDLIPQNFKAVPDVQGQRILRDPTRQIVETKVDSYRRYAMRVLSAVETPVKDVIFLKVLCWFAESRSRLDSIPIFARSVVWLSDTQDRPRCARPSAEGAREHEKMAREQQKGVFHYSKLLLQLGKGLGRKTLSNHWVTPM